jgi:hypothetical protein
MVKKLLMFLVYMLFFFFALVMFTPKASLYFFMEKNIKPFGVVISNETLDERLFSLGVANLEVSIKGVDAAVAQKADITLLGFYNEVKVEGIKLSSMASSFVPVDIGEIKLHYTPFDPLFITGDAQGKFGKADISLSLRDFHLKVVLHPSKLMLQRYRNSLRQFQKTQNGEYIYDKSL